MAVECQVQSAFNVTKRVLVYKLLILEQIRNTMEKELRTFTGKANEAVQDFLNMNDAKATHDCTEVIMTLDLKCNVIHQLSTFFKELKAGIEPPCGLKVVPVAENLYPHVQTTPASHYTSRRIELRVSDVLHFGPMLQNAIMATSITNAIQTFGAMLSLHHIQTALASHSEVVLHSRPSSREVDVRACDSASGAERESVVAASDYEREVKYLREEQGRHLSLRMDLGESHTAPLQKVHSMVEQPLPQFPDWGQGSCLRVHHQKQTSSQLIRFIRRTGDTDGLARVTFFKGKPSAAPQQRKVPDKQGADEESRARVGSEKRPLASLVPVFKPKRKGSAGSQTYSCIVATESELWDVADVFAEDAPGVSGRPPPREEESTAESSSESYFEVLGVSRQGPSSAGPSQPAGAKELDVGGDPPGLMTAPTTVTGVNAAVRIPEFKIRKFEEMEVVVSHLVSPSEFCVQHVNSELQRLSRMMDSALKPRGSLAQVYCVPDMGTCVAAWFPQHGLWCRAQVLRICGMQAERDRSVEGGEGTGGDGRHIELEVRRIDFGDSARLPLRHLRELDAETAAVPQQALQVALANVSPVSGQDWTTEAVGWFKDKVKGRTLYARLYPQGKDVRIELFMEKGKIGAMRRGSSLSLRLAQNGHAHHDSLKHMKGSVLEKTRGKASQWERDLLSCYSQNRK